MAQFRNWLGKPLRGLLVDVTGVLYDSGEGDGVAINGSVEAIKSNESTSTRAQLAAKLNRLGFQLSTEQIFTPPPATVHLLKQRNFRPHLLVHPDVLPEFDSISKDNPNCVVMGDAQQEFNYDNITAAFQLLMKLENPILISMGCGKYYRETDGLKMDVGGFAKAFEYACDITAEVVGKPAASYFQAAVHSMNLANDEVLAVKSRV